MTAFATLGRPALIAALTFAVVSFLSSTTGALRHDDRWARTGARALYVATFFVGLAGVALGAALLAHDFSYEYVAAYSSRSLSGPYALSSLWGGMEGSLLLWTSLLVGFAALAVRGARRESSSLAAWACAVLAGIAIFFLVLIVMPADPFARGPAPLDGRGLNPLLQSPAMLIHPPLLYAGFVGFSIPFAFAMASLFSGRQTDGWFTITRRWTLFAWSALSIGIVLGGAWAYTELGWGGYWAWDPVENASFMPWLTATAFLHSVVIQEKRRMFKVWNISLILLTYVLAVFGTFLTRSGILSSVHTFTEGPLGKWFLPFLGLMLIGGLATVALRLDPLRAENRLDSLLSRESLFMANNVLFLAAALSVFWGTMYPIIAELITGTRLSVGPPFFNSVFVPLALLLLLLTGIGPLVSWRRMSPRALGRLIAVPAAVAAVTGGIALVLGAGLAASAAFALCGFVTGSVSGEFIRGGRIYRSRTSSGWLRSISQTLLRNRRRYGGYVVHLGIVLIVAGLAGGAWKEEAQALVAPGDSMRVGSYELVYEELVQSSTAEKDVFGARLAVLRDGEPVTDLTPSRNFHIAQRQWQSEIAIRSTPAEDLYVVVTSFDTDGTAAIRAFVNPLTWWIWVGAGVMAMGMLVIFSAGRPKAATAPMTVAARRPVPAAGRG